jgi:hypothetical protein
MKITKQALKRIIKEETKRALKEGPVRDDEQWRTQGGGPAAYHADRAQAQRIANKIFKHGKETYRVTVDDGDDHHELDFAGASSVVDKGKNKDGKVVLLIDDKVEFILDMGMTIYKLDKIARGTPTQADEDTAALDR